MRTSVLSAESLLFAVLNRVVKSLKLSSLGYPIVFFRMGDRASSSALMSAYHHVKRTGDAIRKAGRMFGVPESTLRRRLNNPETQSVGHPTLFSGAEENELADHCRNMARLGYGYCRWQVLEMAGNMAKQTGRDIEPKKDWYYNFIKRCPDLSIQKPKKREISRVRGTTEVNVKNYFQELDIILTKYNLKNKPEQIWNIDETGITLDHNPPKIVATKGERPFVVTAGHSDNTTVIVAGSALGETIPPYVIYKGQRLTENKTKGCLPQTKFITTDNGWSTSETFHDFIFNHFLLHVQPRPCLLLYDGHSTHITIDLITKARENDIHMFVLPPHSSHQLQPLDVGIFSPFKAALSSECHKLMHSQVGRQITKDDLPSLIANAYNASLTVPNLMSAFRKTGVVPFNPEIFKTPEVTSNEEKPKSRKERANVRTIKLLLSDINKKVEQAVNKPQERKRKYVIPTCGAAITEDEFLEKLNEHKQEKEADKTVKTRSIPNMKTTSNEKPSKRKSKNMKIKCRENKRKAEKKLIHVSPKDKENQVTIVERGNKRPIKRKLFSDFVVDVQRQPQKQKTTNKETEKNTAPEVIDSQEPGPSNRRREWLTFYPSDTEDSLSDDDNALCVICKSAAPPEFERLIREEGRVQFLKWGKCDNCDGWVHLKYCSPVQEIERGNHFKCTKC